VAWRLLDGKFIKNLVLNKGISIHKNNIAIEIP
jgi:hypothetical protein